MLRWFFCIAPFLVQAAAGLAPADGRS